MTTLEELRAKVAAGVFPADLSNRDLGWDVAILVPYEAFSGSLDAAKALHEAVLPGWSAVIQTNGAVQLHCPVHGAQTPAYNNDPARAWLLAILDALIAKETPDAD